MCFKESLFYGILERHLEFGHAYPFSTKQHFIILQINLLGHELWRLFKRIRTYILFIKLMKHWFCVTFSLNWSSGECYKRTCTTARILILLLHIFPFSEGMAHCLNNVHLSKFTQGYVPSICHLVKGGGGGSKPPRSKGAGWTLLNQTGGVIYRQRLGKIYSKES